MSYWQAWHDAYSDPGSSLSERLRVVREQISGFLDERAPGPVQVLSLCAGDGRDLLEVLGDRVDASRVRGTLLELDEALAAAARDAAAGLSGIEVRTADAGDPGEYAGLPPADLVMLCGVFGNVADEDVHHMLSVLPALCASGARVLWTRSRRAPDLTPEIRKWLGESGFREVAFIPLSTGDGSVGVADLVSPAGGTLGDRRLFTFWRG